MYSEFDLYNYLMSSKVRWVRVRAVKVRWVRVRAVKVRCVLTFQMNTFNFKFYWSDYFLIQLFKFNNPKSGRIDSS